MAARLHYAAFVKYSNLFTETTGGKPVGDINGRRAFCNSVKSPVDLILGDGIQGCRGLVQKNKRRVLAEGSGNGDFLSLSAGDLSTI